MATGVEVMNHPLAESWEPPSPSQSPQFSPLSPNLYKKTQHWLNSDITSGPPPVHFLQDALLEELIASCTVGQLAAKLKHLSKEVHQFKTYSKSACRNRMSYNSPPTQFSGYNSNNSSLIGKKKRSSSLQPSPSPVLFEPYKPRRLSSIPHPRPQPLHFQAISLASELLKNPNRLTNQFNSNRTSQRICRWTLGLLKRVNTEEIDIPLELTPPKFPKMNLDNLKIEDVNPHAMSVMLSPKIEEENKLESFEDLVELKPLSKKDHTILKTWRAPVDGGGQDDNFSISFSENTPDNSPGSNSSHTGSDISKEFSIPVTPSLMLTTLTTTRNPMPLCDNQMNVSEVLNLIIDSQDAKLRHQRIVEQDWERFIKIHCSKYNSQQVLVMDRLQVSKLTPKDFDELVRLVKLGIPEKFRCKIWFEISGGALMKEIGYYRGLLIHATSSADQELPFVKQIELDLCRTMPQNTYFTQSPNSIHKLRRILIAYSLHNPAIGYCQGFNFICAHLLINLEFDEEIVFWTFASMIERILPKDYFTEQFSSSQEDQMILSDLVELHLPKLYKHLTGLGVDLGAITFNWFLSLFTDCFSSKVLNRIWDNFMLEGEVVLFRISLQLLKLGEADLLSYKNCTGCYSCLKNLPNLLHFDNLDEAMQNNWGLPAAQLDSLRVKRYSP
jgi:hypothetical protein